VKRIIHWSLLAVTVIYVLTGLGITQYGIIEPLTLGILSKSLSFNIHDNLLIPFFILLSLHILLKLLPSDKKNAVD
jgi:dolichol kinase